MFCSSFALSYLAGPRASSPLRSVCYDDDAGLEAPVRTKASRSQPPAFACSSLTSPI